MSDLPVYLLQYNNLKHDLQTELIKLGRFLGVKDSALNNSTHIDCVVRNSGAELKRETYRFTKSPFTKSMNETINKCINRVQDVVKKKYKTSLNL